MWLRLPPSERQYCHLQKLSHYKNVKELAISNNRYSGTPPDLDKLVDDVQREIRNKNTKCIFHPQSSHDSNECTHYINMAKEFNLKKRGSHDSVNHPAKRINNASTKVSMTREHLRTYRNRWILRNVLFVKLRACDGMQ